MKRGLIRIFSGIAMIVVQLLGMIGRATAEYTDPAVWSNPGFYAVGVVGIILLIAGIIAFRNESSAELVLHRKDSKFHGAMRWVGFGWSASLLMFLLLELLISASRMDTAELVQPVVMLFALLFFALYFLFYMYKKPTALFSAALIFTGVRCLVGFIFDVVVDAPYGASRLFIAEEFCRLSTAGILYIVVASMLHRETFHVKTVKIFGWILLGYEALGVLFHFVFDPYALSELLFVLIPALYICLIPLNTLRGATNAQPEYVPQTLNDGAPIPAGNWRCDCGRVHPRYESSCVCGKSKIDCGK